MISPHLITEPFLQLPTASSVRVVWFTDFFGNNHTVTWGENLEKSATAKTIKLTRIREDQNSRFQNQTEDGQIYQKPVIRDIWRHEAEVTNLTPNKRENYRITSITENNQILSSKIYTLTTTATPGTPQKILLTSDHQIKPMVAANLQKVVETVGQVDAVWFAGDLVNLPDRASEWFDDNRGNAFFPCLQGRAKYHMQHKKVQKYYRGGEIIQHAPIFTCIGNHEVMGRYNRKGSLKDEIFDAIPRAVAQQLYGNESLKENSYNTDTYEEIFTLPQSEGGGKIYYAVTLGDVRLVVLYITNIWRFVHLDKPDFQSKYAENPASLNNPENWGYGQHIFEPIAKGSKQYKWLQKELSTPEFQQAKYKVVMFHHPPHTLGDNILPPYTDPVQIIQRDEEDNIKSVRYEYPKNADYITRDVMPLLEAAKVQLVFYGHSHLWNRFTSPSGMHFLETSNVGNSYGAAHGETARDNLPPWESNDYIVVGDPNGLEPVVPTIEPLLGEDGKPLPYVASNDITVFSIFETATGIVSSYRFDTRKPNSEVIKFDEFKLGEK
ncbi:MAG: metallophosphoesterase family protein [Scytonematopsis contorta HA4267-MV1]|jgi:predicted phosphodiesterase|nr:metallophosphoesterase family protein [Scytonematopsis contorta HA4267-MV1]